MLRLNPWDFGRPTMFSEAEYADLDSSLFSGMMGGPFISSLELRREATVALERSGDYRASVIWLAAAAESVFDELLRHLMWEEGQLPERCTEEFETLSVAARVKARFGKRLGGLGTSNTQSGNGLESKGRRRPEYRLYMINTDQRMPRQRMRLQLPMPSLVTSATYLYLSSEWYLRTAIKLVGHEGLERRGVYDDFKTCADADTCLDWSSTYAHGLEPMNLCSGRLVRQALSAPSSTWSTEGGTRGIGSPLTHRRTWRLRC